MSKGQCRNYDRFAAVCFFLMQQPHTVNSLVEALGLPKHGGSEISVAKCLHSLQAEGLVTVVGLEPQRNPPIRKRAHLWGWAFPPAYTATPYTKAF